MTDSDRLSRRTLLRGGIGAVVGAAGVAALARGGGIAEAAGGGTLVYANYGGTYQELIKTAMFDPFSKATGIQVDYTADASDVTKLISMAKLGHSEDDLVDAQGPVFAQLSSNGALQKLDPQIVARGRAEINNPSLVTDFNVPYYQFSHNIFWNTSLVSGRMNSWADVWDVEKFPGKRGFGRLPWFNLEIALAADGVPIERLYPLDVDRAFKSLDRIKPHAVFLDLNSETNAFATGEFVTGDLNLVRVKTIQKSGVKLQYTWNQAMIDVEQLVVPAGAADRDAAMKAVDYSLDPDTQLRIMNVLGYTPTSKAALRRIPSEAAKDLPGTPQTVGHSFYLNATWWAQNYRAVSARFQAWLNS